MEKINSVKCFCKLNKPKVKFIYKSKPKYETNFFIKKKNYFRKIIQCKACDHLYSQHKIDLSRLYDGKYLKSTYGTLEKLKVQTEKILNYPLKKSDNKNRVMRINKFIRKKLNIRKIHILDFGSGLGVFPYEMKKNSRINIIAYEKDKLYRKHHVQNLNLKSEAVSLINLTTKYKNKFNLITFNKVLEHIKKPELILKKICKMLDNKSYIYIELPSCNASIEGKLREEFFIDHFHIFSKRSLEQMCEKSGFKSIHIKEYRDPSNKYSIYGFFKKKN